MTTKKTKADKKKKPARAGAGKGSQRKRAAPASKKKPARKKAPAKKKAAKKTAWKKPAKKKRKPRRQRPGYSMRELAFQLGYDESTIREHIKDNGGPVEEKTGRSRAMKLDPAKWHRFLMERAEGSGSPLLEARTRKTEAEAAAKELELKHRAGQLIEFDFVIDFFTEVMLLIATTLDAIAGRSAEGDAVLRAGFLREVRNAREVVHGKIKSYIERLITGAGSSETAAGSNFDGLGRSEKDTAKR